MRPETQFQLDMTSALQLDANSRIHLGRHQRNAALLSEIIADVFGFDPQQRRLIMRGTALHDVGKLCLPSSIVNKPSPLSADEMEQVRLHTLAGYARLTSFPPSPQLDLAAEIALEHHERWDGKGYPFGKSGTDISLPVRIASICDVYSALREVRSYKSGLSHEAAMRAIEAGSGSQFDPQAVNALSVCELRIGKIIDSRVQREPSC